MYSNKVIILILTLSFGLFLGESLTYFNFLSHQIIFIESEESKTKELTSVFNQIKWISSKEKDIWMMNQSHFGENPEIKKWERLAIVIDKTKKPLVAKFYQLKPGPLEWNDSLPNSQVSFRASCFTCHSNGPRAIRPNPNESKIQMTNTQNLQVLLMNLRIKSYGRIHFDKSHSLAKVSPPFLYQGPGELDELNVKTCNRCHNEDGFISRGALSRQQSGTIKFMLTKGHMPPTGFNLTKLERKQINDFIRGF